MKRKSTIKIHVSRLEEDRRKSEDRFEYQKVMLFFLPLIMIAVLLVGVYFGYLSYQDNFDNTTDETRGIARIPEYTQEEELELLKVVSSASPVESFFVPKLAQVNEIKVNSLMAENLNLMLNDAVTDGVNIEIVSGYISFEEQKEKYDSAVKEYKKKKKCSTVKAEAVVKKTIPNAGESEEQTGLIVYLSSDTEKKFTETKEFHWLNKHAADYGFVLRYPDKENTGGLSYSANLYRFVGCEHALNMRKYNMNLDEYVQYLAVQ